MLPTPPWFECNFDNAVAVFVLALIVPVVLTSSGSMTYGSWAASCVAQDTGWWHALITI